MQWSAVAFLGIVASDLVKSSKVAVESIEQVDRKIKNLKLLATLCLSIIKMKCMYYLDKAIYYHCMLYQIYMTRANGQVRYLVLSRYRSCQ